MIKHRLKLYNLVMEIYILLRPPPHITLLMWATPRLSSSKNLKLKFFIYLFFVQNLVFSSTHTNIKYCSSGGEGAHSCCFCTLHFYRYLLAIVWDRLDRDLNILKSAPTQTLWKNLLLKTKISPQMNRELSLVVLPLMPDCNCYEFHILMCSQSQDNN